MEILKKVVNKLKEFEQTLKKGRPSRILNNQVKNKIKQKRPNKTLKNMIPGKCYKIKKIV